jgi:uncharacterized protein
MNGRADGRSSFKTIAILTLIPVIALLLLFGWNVLNGGAPPEDILRIDTQPDSDRIHAAPATVVVPEPPPIEPPAKPASEASALPPLRRPRAAGVGGSLVLIIDDVGYEGQPLDRLMALDPNISLSILPNSDSAASFANRLHEAGYEVLCHLPMEPNDGSGVSPGRGALLTSMSDDELAAATKENVAAVPYARGVNNHMGSKATRDRRVMQSVLGALPPGLFFIDSRTTGGSVAGRLAQSMSIPTASRDVFLDDTQTEAAVSAQLARAVEIARSGRTAIAIGHPHRATLAVLTRELPRLKAEGLKIVRASEAVN